MKFNRLVLPDNSRGWTYNTVIDGEDHHFSIVPRYVADADNNYRGYDVYHTGPRPEMVVVRQRDNEPLDDNERLISSRPIPTLRDVKRQMQLLIGAIEDAAKH